MHTTDNVLFLLDGGSIQTPRARTPDTARQNLRVNTWPTCIRTQGERTYVVIGISRRVIFKERRFKKLFRFEVRIIRRNER